MPAVVDGRLFVTTTVIGTSADVSTVRALRPSDGTTLWSSPNGTGEETSLAVEGNVVALLPSFGPGQTYTIIFLRAPDGSLRSSFSGGDGDVVGMAGPTIKNGTTYFVGAGNGTPLPYYATFLQSFTKDATLTPGWKSPKTSAGPATPVATSEGVYLPDKTAVSLLATATGAVKATMLPTAAEGHFRTPFDVAVDADRVYLGYLNANDQRADGHGLQPLHRCAGVVEGDHHRGRPCGGQRRPLRRRGPQRCRGLQRRDRGRAVAPAWRRQQRRPRGGQRPPLRGLACRHGRLDTCAGDDVRPVTT